MLLTKTMFLPWIFAKLKQKYNIQNLTTLETK